MYKKYILLFVSVILLTVTKVYGQIDPVRTFDSLFIQVQLSGIFDDSKTFPDATPFFPPDTILNRYDRQKNNPDFHLDTFINGHFQLPSTIISGKDAPSTENIMEHIHALWYTLRREDTTQLTNSRIALPHPYVVPGGRFREIYYWDSYFTMLGLRESGQTEMIRNMTDNFAWLIDRFGYIPNGNRTYYLSRSQPPYFALMVSLLADIKDDSVLLHYYPQIRKEYNFWMDGKDRVQTQQSYKRVVKVNDSITLNRYWDNKNVPRPESYREDHELYQDTGESDSLLFRNIRAACESGWDFSSRWLGDEHSLKTIQTTEIIPVDLNALLYYYEVILAECAKMAKDTMQFRQYKQDANNRKAGILMYCWDSISGFFTDYHIIEKEPTHKITLAGMYPLFFNIATYEQAELQADKIKKYFLYDGGLVTSLSLSRQQWDAPNGWAPLQYISIAGLENYGFSSLATEIANRWLLTTEMTYSTDGKLMEKYDVIYPDIPGGGGEYPAQDGFGWTNGVYLYLHANYRKDDHSK